MCCKYSLMKMLDGESNDRNSKFLICCALQQTSGWPWATAWLLLFQGVFQILSGTVPRIIENLPFQSVPSSSFEIFPTGNIHQITCNSAAWESSAIYQRVYNRHPSSFPRPARGGLGWLSLRILVSVQRPKHMKSLSYVRNTITISSSLNILDASTAWEPLREQPGLPWDRVPEASCSELSRCVSALGTASKAQRNARRTFPPPCHRVLPAPSEEAWPVTPEASRIRGANSNY